MTEPQKRIYTDESLYKRYEEACGKEYYKEISEKTDIAENAGCFRVTETSWVKLCGVPVVKVKTKGNVRRYVLFGVLPCWKKAEGRDA